MVWSSNLIKVITFFFTTYHNMLNHHHHHNGNLANTGSRRILVCSHIANSPHTCLYCASIRSCLNTKQNALKSFWRTMDTLVLQYANYVSKLSEKQQTIAFTCAYCPITIVAGVAFTFKWSLCICAFWIDIAIVAATHTLIIIWIKAFIIL